MESVFYYPVTLHTTDNSSPFELIAPATKRLPSLSPGSPVQVQILSDSEGSLTQGLYFWDTQRWRYSLPMLEICRALIEGDTIDLYYRLTADVTVTVTSAHIYRNSIPTTNTTLPGNVDVIYVVRQPLNTATGDVASVNGRTPDATGNVAIGIANIPGLQAALDNAGQVKTVSGQTPDGSGNIAIQASDVSAASGTSLIGNSGAITGNIKLKRIVAGTGITLAADGNGNLQINSAVQSVSGQTGAVVIKAQDNNAASGTSLIVGDGSGTGTIKLKTLVAGTNITLTADTNGNIQIAAAGGGSVTKVQSEGTGISLVDNDGTSGGIATIKSIAAGSNITITPAGDGKTLTITANQAITPATTTTIGGVIVKAGLAVDGSGNLTLAAPTGVNLGGVKAGSNITIAADGTISSTLAATVTSFATGTSGQLHGDIVFAAGQAISLSNAGNTIQINGTGVPEAPNDGNQYARQNMGWTLLPSLGSAITSITGQAGTGAVLLVEAAPPANSAIIKSLVAGANVTLTESNGLITVAASIPGGTVATVNSKTPDGSGNVTLVASDVNALPTAGGTMSGAINMGSTNKITNLAAPTVAGDAVNLGTLTGLVIDGGVIG